MMATRDEALTVTCPSCKAKPGEWCVSYRLGKGGRVISMHRRPAIHLRRQP